VTFAVHGDLHDAGRAGAAAQNGVRVAVMRRGAAVHEDERVAHLAEFGEDVGTDQIVFPRSRRTRTRFLNSRRALGSRPAAGSSRRRKAGSLKCAREAEALGLALRELVHRALGEHAHIGEIGHLIESAGELGTAQPSAGAREEVEVVGDEYVSGYGAKWSGVQPMWRRTSLGYLDDISAVEFGRAGIGQIKGGEHAHRSGLPRAVGADETDDGAGREIEGDAVDGAHALEAPVESADGEKRGGGAHRAPPCAAGFAVDSPPV